MFKKYELFKRLSQEFEQIIANATGHDASIVKTEDLPARRAFGDAIRTGFLSSNPKAENFAGHYMYMGDYYGEALFKYHDTRQYLCPMPYCHSKDVKTYTVLGMYGEIRRKGVIAETAIGALHELEFGDYMFRHEKNGDEHRLVKTHDPDPRSYDSINEFLADTRQDDEVVATGQQFEDLVAALPSIIIPEFTPEGRAKIADIEAPFSQRNITLKQRLSRAFIKQI